MMLILHEKFTLQTGVKKMVIRRNHAQNYPFQFGLEDGRENTVA